MKFNLYLIKDLLRNHLDCQVEVCRISHSVLNCEIDKVLRYDRQNVHHQKISDTSFDKYAEDSLLPSALYILSADDWKALAADSRTFSGSRQSGTLALKQIQQFSFLIWNWDASCPEIANGNYIGLQKIDDPGMLTIAILELFNSLRMWEMDLYQIAASGGAMKEMGDRSLDFLTNPICLYTPSHQNIFFSERKKPKNLLLFAPDEQNELLPSEDIEELRFDEDFLQTLDETEPAIFPDELFGYRILYYNIRINGLYVARIMSCEVDRPICDSDYILLRKLGEIMSFLIERENWTINGHVYRFDETMKQLMNREHVKESQLTEILAKNSWKLSDEYFCAVIPFSEEDRRMNIITGLCIKIESSIKGSSAILKDNVCVVLFNITFARSDRDEMISALVLILRDYYLRAGMSMSFTDIQQLFYYFQQAEKALFYGQREDPTIWYYHYEHYEMRHLLDNAQSETPLETYYPAGLRKLLAYDRAHNRTYTHALKIYLEENMSVAATIRRLYIRKSTFVYQLQRIHEISGINLKNKDTQLLYLLIFRMMDMEDISNSGTIS